MSYIISSGNKKPQWVPESKAKKTAQLDVAIDKEVPMEEEPNPFFDAVKDLPGIKDQATGIGLGEALDNAQKAIDTAKEVAVKEGVIEPGGSATATPVGDAAPAPAPAAPDLGGAPAAPAEDVKVDVGGEAPKEEGKSENPFAKKDEGSSEAPKEEKKEEAPQFEKKEEAPKEADEVEIEIPGVKEEEGEVEKESSGMSANASVDSGKLKAIAKLSPENRKDLSKFWKEDLGMPSDYVDAMLKDY